MDGVDLTVEICGMSGDGTIAAGGLLNAALTGAGFHLLAFDSYPAEIRGFGRCVTRARIGDQEMQALERHTQVLISLDDEQSLSRVEALDEAAVVLFDNRPPTFLEEGRSIAAHVGPAMRLFGIPFGDLSAAATGSARARNLVALGGFAALFGVDREFFLTAIEKKFGAKGDSVLEANRKGFEAGYAFVLENYRDRIDPMFRDPPVRPGGERVLFSGNEAIAKGALDAGLKLYFGYPITPATPIMEILAARLPERGGRVLQMEDEISSIGAVLGSFFAGKRAMTATSGPGFALMTELITHGVMAEIPAVILNAQRGGPSTGLPTKTEQSDLHAAVFGGPGDSARIVMAPTNVAECYRYTLASFRIAEKFQTPVILLTDFYLDNRVEDISPPTPTAEDQADGNLYPDPGEKGHYRRYRLTPSGISPRALPGAEGFIFRATGLEHSETGFPDYDRDNHMRMSEKRHRKILGALAELPAPEFYGPPGPLDVGVVAWGSTVGAALEAVHAAQEEGLSTGALKVTTLSPLHEAEIRSFMDRCSRVLIPELNYEGQLANLLGHLCRTEVVRLNQVGGVPMLPSEILEKIRDMAPSRPRPQEKI